MVKVARRVEKIPEFVLRLSLLVAPQVFGVLVLGWNWRLMMVQFFLQLASRFVIDFFVILSKPRRLYDDPVSKWMHIKRLLVISILLLPLGGGIVELAYGSNSFYTPRVEFFEQHLPEMLLLSLGYLLVDLILTWMKNREMKMSEIDMGQQWMPMVFSLLVAIIVAVALDNNKIKTVDNILWILLLIMQGGFETGYFLWRRNPKNRGKAPNFG